MGLKYFEARTAAVYPFEETVAQVYAPAISLPLTPTARALTSPQSSQRWHPSNGISQDLRPLIALLVTGESLIKFNPVRQLACRIPG
jgi:hypothetical protein